MKKFLSSLVAGLILFGLTSASAATISANLLTNGVANLLSTGAVIYKITVADSSGATSNVKLFDSSTAVVTNVIGAYTNFTLTNGNSTNIFTNVLNVVTTNIYTNVLIQAAQTVAQTTNSMPVIVALTVPNNSTAISSPANPYYAFSGIAVTNDAVATITIEYSPFK